MLLSRDNKISKQLDNNIFQCCKYQNNLRFYPSVTMQILKNCKTVLAYAGLGDKQYVRIGGKNVSKTTVQCFILVTNMLFGLSQIIICAKHYENGLNAMLFSLQFILVIITKGSMYISFTRTTGTMAKLFDLLENVVNERMVMDFILFLLKVKIAFIPLIFLIITVFIQLL